MSQWTVRYGELVIRDPLFGVPIGIHGVLTIYNASGVAVRWFDGQATDPVTLLPRPIGSQFTGELLNIHTGVGSSPLARNERIVANISEDGANKLIDALFRAKTEINAQNIPYQLPPGSWGREPTNSNSALSTLFKIAGLELPDSIGGAALGQTGRGNTLLSDSAIDGIRAASQLNTIPLDIKPPPRCFVAGTPIDMADGTKKPIEEIVVGDEVMAFDPLAAQGLGPVMPRRVTKTFRNTTQVLIEVAGLRVTPGHEVLSDGGEWMSIAEVLRRDRALVRDVEDGEGGRRGEPFRARTGARLGGLADIVFATRYHDAALGRWREAHVRGGIPFAMVGFQAAHGAVSPALLPLYQVLDLDRRLDARATLAAGQPIGRDGRPLGAIDWPEGRTHFDHEGGENHVVALDGRPHTPAWIAAIPREGEESPATLDDWLSGEAVRVIATVAPFGGEVRF